jgi:gluconate 2-dehydrogenase gamma chain
MTHNHDHTNQDQSNPSEDAPVQNRQAGDEHRRSGGSSRRLFLKGSGATAALGGMATLPATRAIAQDTAATPASTPGQGMAGRYGDPSDSNAPVAFFSMFEATTVGALTARIMPGTSDDPGAREAGVVYYIDRQLSGANLGYTLKTYSQGPFLSTEASGGSVSATSQSNLYQYVFVQGEDVPRYGY